MNTPTSPFTRRGEVYWLDFDPATGHEMAGPHPCVIVQNDLGNQHSAVTIVVAVTSNLRIASLPVVILLRAGTGGLTRDSVVHCGHVYTVDKARLGKKIGELPPEKVKELDLALARSLGLGRP